MTVLGNDGSEQPAVVEVYAVNPGRQITALNVQHGAVQISVVGAKPSYPKYVVANQINNIHQTKILVVDPTMPDASGGKSENINVKFKLKVKYMADKASGKVTYAGSILYSFPGVGGETIDASGPIDCVCINQAGAPVECQKSTKENEPEG